ncbi:XRE family transcriptional regulator [Kribbella sancticallisti]|uniref:XRE family transcriptional regulator n=1 Tax=Kribbella sancticallisti TaxID=460087 RepID=A0ABN2C7W1_9ACTN
MSVAQLLRRFRARAGLTQESLAEATGLSVQAISALEGGRRRHPRPLTVDLLAKALDLSAEDRLTFEQAGRRTASSADDESAMPGQLPPPITDFTGRNRQLDELLRILRSPYGAAPGVLISAIGGMGGIGKTTLAVEAAHQVAEEYPDGQLYLNLRGGGGDPLEPAQAITQLLNALGIPVSGDPEDLEFAAARYRTALAGRRVLVLLDDATSVAQVTPLIPGVAGSAVVVTSRRGLATLPGVRRLALEPLTEDEALHLLGEIAGHHLVEAAPEAALAVVRECGLLPLAVRIAGGQAAGDLSSLARRLADDTSRLDVLTDPGQGVRSSISLSVAALATSDRPADVAAAKAFPTVSLFGGDHFSLRVAAKVLDLPMDDTEDLLDRLVDVHLLETPGLHEYRMHDLVRDVGRELAATDGEEALAELRRRELECYVAMLWRYDELRGYPEKYGARTGRAWSQGAEDVVDVDQAKRWLVSELPTILRLVRKAAMGDPEERLLAVRMALGMPRLAVDRMRFAEAHQALAIAVRICDTFDSEIEIGRLYQFGSMCCCLGLYGDGVHWNQRVLPLAREKGTSIELATCLINLGHSLGWLGRAAEGMPYAEEALAIVKESGIERFEVGANVGLGSLAGWTGDLARQQEAFDRALELMPLRSAPGPAAVHRNLIGRSLQETGQYDAAVAVLTANLEQIRAQKLDVIEVDALQELGSALLAKGDHRGASDALTTALEIAVRYPAEHREAPILQVLGQLHAGLGQTEAARACWQRSLLLFERAADPSADRVRELLAGSGAEG